MKDSFNVLMKLILPEGVEEYFELTSHKNEGSTPVSEKFNIQPIEFERDTAIQRFFDV